MNNFTDFIERERERIYEIRDGLFEQRLELKARLATVNQELAAIDAYEAVRMVKPRARGSIRGEVLDVLSVESGLTRGDIAKKLGVHRQRSGQAAVSNALHSLLKGKQISREDGRYWPAKPG